MSNEPQQHSVRDHHEDGPSSWPKWKECPSFKGDGKAGKAAQRGTRIHEAAEMLLAGKSTTSVVDLSQDELEAAEWGVERTHEIVGDLFESEIRVAANIETEFGVHDYFGWLDVLGGSHLIDYKSGSIRNYREQFVGYALPIMRERFLDEITFHIIYVDQREIVEQTYTIDEVEEIARECFTIRKDPNRKPTACNYCSWCAHAATCPALSANIVEMAPMLELEAAGTEAVDDSLDLETEEGRGNALRSAKLLITRCEALIEKIRDGAVGDGQAVDGYKTTLVKGKEAVNLKLAHSAVGTQIGTDRFLSACSINANKLRAVCEDYYGEVPQDLEKLVTRGDSHQQLKPIKQSP